MNRLFFELMQVAVGTRSSLSRVLTDGEEIGYHHIDMCGVYDCEVEVHFRPQFLDVPWRNRWFQRWGEEQQGVCYTMGI